MNDFNYKEAKQMLTYLYYDRLAMSEREAAEDFQRRRDAEQSLVDIINDLTSRITRKHQVVPLPVHPRYIRLAESRSVA